MEPTVLGYPKAAPGGKRGPLADLDYVVGSAALAQSSAGMALTYPMKEGIITDFDACEVHSKGSTQSNGSRWVRPATDGHSQPHCQLGRALLLLCFCVFKVCLTATEIATQTPKR